MIVATMLASLVFTYAPARGFEPPKLADTVRTRALPCAPQDKSKGCKAVPLRNGPPCYLSSNLMVEGPDHRMADMPSCNRRYDMM